MVSLMKMIIELLSIASVAHGAVIPASAPSDGILPEAELVRMFGIAVQGGLIES
jgi:hypothetical protein